MRPVPLLAACGVLALVAAGCSCNESGLSGDAGFDGDPPPWANMPPVPSDRMGLPGWRGSGEPFCHARTYGFITEMSVWSYSGGVYVLITDLDESKTYLYSNHGTGWSPPLVIPSRETHCTYRRVHGLPDGTAFLLGDYGGECMILVYRDGGFEYLPLDARDVFVVSEDLAYALVLDRDAISVYRYNGDWWEALAPTIDPGMYRLWADEDVVFAAGMFGSVVSRTEDGWMTQDTGTGAGFSAIWGFSGDDVWVAEIWNVLRHYDGESWSEVTWPNHIDLGDNTLIEPMWGAEGTFFMASDRQLTMWDGSSFNVLIHGDIWIRDIWGNSPTEVFFAVSGGGLTNPVNPDCGYYYLLWWDGHEFHWF